MKKYLILLLIPVMLFASACSPTDITEENKKVLAAEVDTNLINANGTFAFDLFKELNSQDDGNLFISPLSVSSALGMTYNGAMNETKNQMASTLSISDISLEEYNLAYKDLLDSLEEPDKKVDLNISNSVWIKQDEKIKQTFIDNVTKYFNSEVIELDFSKSDAADTINNWIDNATNGKISKMLNPPISSDVIMYLINAIYFKGEWTTQFDPDLTFDSTFTSSENIQEDVKMMSRKGEIEYTEINNVKAVKLPYGEERFAMYCILPDGDIDEYISMLDTKKWDEIKSSLTKTEDVLVQIPRFKIEYGIKDLSETLINLGMPIAFSSGANFSNIRDDLYISRVLHKAVIEVNEEGSEAAAVTVIEMKLTAIMDSPQFIANKPFIFIIEDTANSSILFMGKLDTIE